MTKITFSNVKKSQIRATWEEHLHVNKSWLAMWKLIHRYKIHHAPMFQIYIFLAKHLHSAKQLP